MRRKIKRLYPILLVILILAAGFFLVRSNFFQVKSVACELENYPCALIYEPVLVSLHRQNILQLSGSRITQQFQSIDSGIESVALRRRLPDKIFLTLKRREVIARLELTDDLSFSASISGSATGQVFFLDKTGAIFAGLAEINNQSPVVNLPGDKPIVLGKSDFSQSIYSLITALNDHFVSSVKIIWLPPANSIVQIASGPYVLIDLEKDIFAAIASLQYILSGFKIEDDLPVKIDLRFDKPVLIY